MSHRRLCGREYVFIQSLMYHGFRYTRRRTRLKRGYNYIIPSTGREDAVGVDAWIKLRGDDALVPVQVTQRGIRLYRKHNGVRPDEFLVVSYTRIRTKQRRCRQHGILFVLVRDFDGTKTNHTIAWGDVKALRYALGISTRRRGRTR